MEASVAALPRLHVTARPSSAAWPTIAFLLGATSILAGLLWDISWHKTIGRDTFWTPAHLAIHFGGIVAGLTGAFLILRTTFGGDEGARAASVRVWGFRGPLGAWLSIWGCFAMITSAPFDDWWHNAYGLDVKILSPPHVVLAMGMFGVVYGAVLIAVARQNREGLGEGDGEPWVKFGYVYACGILMTMLCIIVSEYTEANEQHGAMFFYIIGALFPYTLVGLGRASRLRWPMTSIAAVYMGAMIGMNLLLQPFPAHPRLAPIYIPVDHMVPFTFPLLLIVPAFVLDLLLRRFRNLNDWLLALLLGISFLAVLGVTQWYAAYFFISRHADNFFFIGAKHLSYFDRPGSWVHEFWDRNALLTPAKAGIATVLAIVSTRLGLARGKWMRQVVR
jgi:hypothetical protein